MTSATSKVTKVFKNGGSRPNEDFNPAKLQRSVSATCRSLRCPDGQSEDIGNTVASLVGDWASTKPMITSADIRRRASTEISKLHEEAAYLYQHQPELL